MLRVIAHRHLTTVQVLGASIGDSISPRIFTTPCNRPRNLADCSFIGTSFATGRPRLVINTGSRVARTSSMIARQCVLNWPAEISFMLFVLKLLLSCHFLLGHDRS